jgi:membrane fusion protein (multidrug efflux system)
LLIVGAVLAGCGSGAEGGRQAGGRGGPGGGGPKEVGFVIVQAQNVPVINELGGRTVAFETSEVRPQVNGLVQQRLFTEGSYVKAGQPLYRIDARLYQAAANQQQANVANAQAAADAARARAARYRPLAEIEAVSQQEYTDAAAQARQAAAQVRQNQAALETARINLRFTTIRAPISGRIGRSLFTQGALVSNSQAEPLAVIQRVDPIFVDIQQSSAALTTLKRALASGGATPGSTQVRLALEDGSDYGYTGTVQFSEMTVNEATGTVTLRARFPNPQGTLLPGMFVQASFVQAVTPGAILVPQSALQRDLGGEAYVFIVGPANKAVRRNVAAERTYGTNWVVTGGLRPGDRVITQGLANLREGAPLKPVAASTPQRVAPRPAEQGAAGGGGGGRSGAGGGR